MEIQFETLEIRSETIVIHWFSIFLQIDEGRAELPLTADKQDTFPIGLALETGCTHHVTIGNKLKLNFMQTTNLLN